MGRTSSITMQPPPEPQEGPLAQHTWGPSRQEAAFHAGQQYPSPPGAHWGPNGPSTPPGFPPLAPPQSMGHSKPASSLVSILPHKPGKSVASEKEFDRDMQRTINSNLPKFDGAGNVGGFLRVFEQMQGMYGASERQMVGALFTCLKGSALSWL